MSYSEHTKQSLKDKMSFLKAFKHDLSSNLKSSMNSEFAPKYKMVLIKDAYFFIGKIIFAAVDCSKKLNHPNMHNPDNLGQEIPYQFRKRCTQLFPRDFPARR